MVLVNKFDLSIPMRGLIDIHFFMKSIPYRIKRIL